MKRNGYARKALALAMALLLLLGLVPFTAFAATEATPELGVPLSVSGTSSDQALLAFTPTESGVYTLASEGGSDPRVSLYCNEGYANYLAGADDENGAQFVMRRFLKAGVPYLYKVDDRSETAEFTVTLTKEPLSILELGVPSEVTGGYYSPAYLLFTPAETGCYVFSSAVEGWADPQATLYAADKAQSYIAENDDNGEDDNFRIECWLTAGESYLLAARGDFSPTSLSVTVEQITTPTAIDILGDEDGVLTMPLTGEFVAPAVAITPADAAQKVTLSVADSYVATVARDELRALKVGETTLTATALGGVSDTVTLAVTLPQQTLSVGKTDVLLPAGEAVVSYTFVVPTTATYRFTLAENADGDTYRYLAVYGLDEDGALRLHNTGGDSDEVMHEIALQEGDTCVVTIDREALDETLDLSLAIGETVPATALRFAEGNALTVTAGYFNWLRLTPQFEPEMAQQETITWSVSDETVATWSGGNTFVVAGEGTVTVTAESENGLTADFVLTVVPPTAIVPDTDYVYGGSTLAYRTGYTFRPPQSGMYIISLEREYIPGSGSDEALNVYRDDEWLYDVTDRGYPVWFEEDAVYEFRMDGYAAHTLRVEEAPKPESIAFTEEDITLRIIDEYWAEVEMFPPTAYGGEFVYTVSDESVLRVYGDGHFLPQKPGTVTVTVTVGDTVSDTMTVTVEEPLTWQGVGTKRVIGTPRCNEMLYHLTVEEEGYYELVGDGGCALFASLYTHGEYGSESMMDVFSDPGVPFCEEVYLYAEEDYYLEVEVLNSLGACDLTLRRMDREIPAEGVTPVEAEMTVTLGVLFRPNYLAADDLYVEITAPAESAVLRYDDGLLQAIGLGTETVTLQCEDGGTATVTVTVTAAEEIEEYTEKEIHLSQSLLGQCFAFVPGADGEYSFGTDGKCDTYVLLYNSDFELLAENDDDIDINACAMAELAAGETYYAVYSTYRAREYGIGTVAHFTAYAGRPIAATDMTVTLNSKGYLFEEDGVYYVLTGNRFLPEVQFSPLGLAAYEICDVVLDDSGQLVWEEDHLMMLGLGRATLTVTSESGFSETLVIQGVSKMMGDINLDNLRDATDMQLLHDHLAGKTDLGIRLLLAQMNEDEAVDWSDYRLLLEEFIEPITVTHIFENACDAECDACGETRTPADHVYTDDRDAICNECGAEREVAKALLGDVDGSGKVDSTDARLVLQYAVKKIDAAKLDTTVADVDGNGKVDSTDARLILQFAVKKITNFPVGA